MSRILLVLLALLAAAALACRATVVEPDEPDRVDTPHFVAPDGSYSLELPLGWVRDGNSLTLDGWEVQTIAFNAGPVLSEADPRGVDIATPQLITAMEDQLLAQPGVRNVECRSTTLGGLPGFRMHFLLADPDSGAEREHLISGAVSGVTLFAFSYEATAGEVFGRQLETFERMVASFQPLESAPGGR